MAEIGAEYILMILCGLIVLSYFFTIISKSIRVPSVLLLLFTGIIFKLIANYYQLNWVMPVRLVEGLGGIGLTMIILEAGLDLRLDRNKFKLIRDSFLSALIILILSAIFVTGIL